MDSQPSKKRPRDLSRSRSVSPCSSPIKPTKLSRVRFRPELLLNENSASRLDPQNLCGGVPGDSNSKSGFLPQ